MEIPRRGEKRKSHEGARDAKPKKKKKLKLYARMGRFVPMSAGGTCAKDIARQSRKFDLVNTRVSNWSGPELINSSLYVVWHCPYHVRLAGLELRNEVTIQCQQHGWAPSTLQQCT